MYRKWLATVGMASALGVVAPALGDDVLLFVIDRSGSIGASAEGLIQEQFSNCFDEEVFRYDGTLRVGLICFDSSASVVLSLTEINSQAGADAVRTTS